MRKLYQILYNVGRLTYAPGRRAFPFQGDSLAVELFPFRGDTLTWASLRGGKALGVTKPAFPPRAPPFRARHCSALWYGSSVLVNACMLLYWWRQAEPIFLFRRTEGGLRSRPVPGGCCIAGANLLLPVVLLVLTCSCLSLYCRRSLAPVCCRITGIDPLPLTTGNRPAARAAFPSDETKIGSA